MVHRFYRPFLRLPVPDRTVRRNDTCRYLLVSRALGVLTRPAAPVYVHSPVRWHRDEQFSLGRAGWAMATGLCFSLLHRLRTWDARGQQAGLMLANRLRARRIRRIWTRCARGVPPVALDRSVPAVQDDYHVTASFLAPAHRPGDEAFNAMPGGG
jgi:hypothetical protein